MVAFIESQFCYDNMVKQLVEEQHSLPREET